MAIQPPAHLSIGGNRRQSLARGEERIGEPRQVEGQIALAGLNAPGERQERALAAIGQAVMQDEVMKNTFSSYAFEHFEIASYRALLEMADAAGDSIGPPLLQQSLEEEIRMAEWIDQHLPQNVRRYIEREAKGLKSGV